MAFGIVAVTSLLLELGGDEARTALAYNRAGLEAGEVWRLLTGHFVHLSLKHLLLNLAGLTLVIWIVGHAYSGAQWLLVVLLSMVSIDAGFWFLEPELAWYVGMSGLVYGLLAAGLVIGAADRELESIVLAILVSAKLAWEQMVGPSPGSELISGGAVVVDAHLYGGVGGLLAALLLWRRVRLPAPI